MVRHQPKRPGRDDADVRPHSAKTDGRPDKMDCRRSKEIGGDLGMERKRIRRVCRLLHIIAVAVHTAAWAAIAIGIVALGNGNLYASFVIAAGVALVLLANGFEESLERRM